MAYEINWNVTAGDPILKHPLYQKYSNLAIGAIVLPAVQSDLAGVLAAQENIAIVNYLAWLIRTVKLTL